jgi:hypothetical protein
MNKPVLHSANPWWPRPLLIFLLTAVILAPLPAGLGFAYDFRTVAFTLLGAAGMAALFLVVDLIAHARSGKDTGLGMAIYKLESFPFQRKLGRIEEEQTEPARLQTRGLMLKDVFVAPALIRLTDDALKMIPVEGETVTVPLAEITELVEGASFNGSWQPGQTGFMLKGPNTWRIGFAIYEDPAPWREALHVADSSSGSNQTGGASSV